jgi:sterol desaturase/sphingolipid hydroxylase (fatty acid hydroxylase superfamily)
LTPEELAAQKQMRTRLIIMAIVLVVILGLIVVAVLALVQAEPGTTTKVRDIFIIFMALMMILLSGALVVLIAQLAILINLLQNEIKPILHSTNETVNTLKGTTAFLSNNLVQPVIKMNEYLAGLKKLLDLLKIGR